MMKMLEELEARLTKLETKKPRRRAMGIVVFSAQVSAPIALIVTSYFSYQAMTQSVKTQEEQRALFRAQYAPEVEISALSLGLAGELYGEFANYGETVALNLCYAISTPDLNSSEFKQINLASNCREIDGSKSGFKIRGETIVGPYLLATSNSVPVGARLTSSAFSITKGPSTSSGGVELFVLLDWEDVTGEWHSGSGLFHLSHEPVIIEEDTGHEETEE